jgi:hypothetical protein
MAVEECEGEQVIPASRSERDSDSIAVAGLLGATSGDTKLRYWFSKAV